jgi:hypothetical protein
MWLPLKQCEEAQAPDPVTFRAHFAKFGARCLNLFTVRKIKRGAKGEQYV